jgi:hypothetical protein
MPSGPQRDTVEYRPSVVAVQDDLELAACTTGTINPVVGCGAWDTPVSVEQYSG